MNSIRSNFIDTEIDKVFNEYHAEHNKGDAARHEKMYHTAVKLMQLLLRQSARQDQHHVNTFMQDQLQDRVKKVQDTHKSKLSDAINVGKTIIEIGSGVLGLSVLVAGQAMAQTLSGASQAGNMISSGIGNVNNIYGERRMSQRTGEEHSLNEYRRNRDDRDRTIQQNEQRQKDALRDAKDGASSHHQAIGEMLR